MKYPLVLTDADGGQLTGTLPGGWADVSMAHYAAFALAPTTQARRAAMATITGLPALAFEEDEDLLANLLLAAPYLYKGPLPEGEPVSMFDHAGACYYHIGQELDELSAFQFQSMLAALDTPDLNLPEAQAAAMPLLLATLYAPFPGASALAFASTPAALADVPMSIGWPALAHLVATVGPRAVAAQTYETVRGQVEQLMNTVQQQLLSSPPKGPAQKVAHALARKGLQQARKVLGSKYTAPKKKRKNG